MCDELTLDMEADAEATAERMERLGYVSCDYCGKYVEQDECHKATPHIYSLDGELDHGSPEYCCKECFDNHDHDESCDCGGFATVGETLDHEFSSEEEEKDFNEQIRKGVYENLRWNQYQEASQEAEARKKEAVTVSAATA